MEIKIVGGAPRAQRLTNEELMKKLKEAQFKYVLGHGYIPEINRGTPEVLNTLYEIAHPQKKEIPYEKGKHSYYQCVYDGEKTYLEIKYRHLPYAKAVIEKLLSEHIPHRKIDRCLYILENNFNTIFLQSYIGTGLTTEIYKIKSCFDITYGKVGIEHLATIQEYLKEVK